MELGSNSKCTYCRNYDGHRGFWSSKLFTKGLESMGDCYQSGCHTNCHSSQLTLSGVLGVMRVMFIIINKGR